MRSPKVLQRRGRTDETSRARRRVLPAVRRKIQGRKEDQEPLGPQRPASRALLLKRLSRRFEVGRRATSTRNDYITQNQFIHFRPEEIIQCFLRFADHGLVLIEGSVEYHRYARQIAEAFDQPVIPWIG